MKLLMTAEPRAGVFTFAVELARTLGRGGVEVHLATAGPLTRALQAEVAGLPGVELHEGRFRAEFSEPPWDDVEGSGEWLLGLAEATGAEVIHLNDFVHASLPWPAPVLVTGHFCAFSRYQAVHGRAPPASWDRYRSLVARGLERVQAVAAPSAALLRELAQQFGPLPGPEVIPSGRDAALFPPGRKEPLVLAIGRLADPVRDLPTLAGVAPGLPWPVLLAGEELARSGGGIAPRALGPLGPEELAGWLGRASIYCHPARYEAFGLSILEAALAGCALVLADLPALRERWTGAALFVPPGDPEALRRELLAAIEAPSSRAILAVRARNRALALTPQETAAAYLRIYRELRAGERPEADELAGLRRPGARLPASGSRRA